jgi:ribonuclease HI
LNTDGSSLKNPGGPGGIGFIVFDRANSALRFGGKQYVADGAHPITNNRMELRAVLESFAGLPDAATVEVFSDSTYVINALTKWIFGWRRRAWTTAEGTPVLNRDLICAVDERARALRVEYRWVRGHAGNSLNELCDALAQSAARGTAGPSKAEILPALRSIL